MKWYNWTGYHRQPERFVFFAGVSHSIPKVEERDLVTVHAKSVTLSGKDDLPDDLRQKVGRILGTAYAATQENHVNVKGRRRDVISVGRDGTTYSEINMGFGEARIHRLLNDISRLPDRSLVLLEEPEISLHPSAQHELGRYLVELCINKRHQVFLTTHSENLLETLPERSRLYLHKTPGGIAVIPGISVGQAASLLAGQHKKCLQILVEDDVAQHIVTELLRKHDPVFLKTVKIIPIGSKQDIAIVMKGVRQMGIQACAVRDGDTGAAPKDNLFKLWGTRPPEIEIFNSPNFRQMLKDRFALNLDEINLQLTEKDHHDWLTELASIIPFPYEAMLQTSAEAYLASVPETERATLVNLLKAVVK